RRRHRASATQHHVPVSRISNQHKRIVAARSRLQTTSSGATRHPPTKKFVARRCPIKRSIGTAQERPLNQCPISLAKAALSRPSPRPPNGFLNFMLEPSSSVASLRSQDSRCS